MHTRCKLSSARIAAIFLALAAFALPAVAAEKVTYGLSWVPQGEHCGFFQAQQRGFYKDVGLDVELRPGNPNVNLPMLVASGEIDMGMGSSFTTMNLVNQGIKVRTVAAFFQKNPQTLVAHPGQGIETLSDLKGRPIMVGNFSRNEFWRFLKARHGFTDDQLRPYAYSAAPFLADPKAVQQGYITEDAFLLGSQLPAPPVSLLLADHGYQAYATTVFATDSYIAAHPRRIQAFVDATSKGYVECLNGAYEPAMRATLALNPRHGEDLFHFKIKQMRERGIVLSGDAATMGIGAMTDQRWKAFFDDMSQAGVYPETLDYKSAYTLQFVQTK